MSTVITRSASKRRAGFSQQRPTLGCESQQVAVLVNHGLVLRIVSFLPLEPALFLDTGFVNKIFYKAVRTPSLYRTIDLRWNPQWFGDEAVIQRLLQFAGSQLQSLTIGVSFAFWKFLSTWTRQRSFVSLRQMTNLGKRDDPHPGLALLSPWVSTVLFTGDEYRCHQCKVSLTENRSKNIVFCWACSNMFCEDCRASHDVCAHCSTNHGSEYHITSCGDAKCTSFLEQVLSECDKCFQTLCPHCIRSCSTCPGAYCIDCWLSSDSKRCGQCTSQQADASFSV